MTLSRIFLARIGKTKKEIEDSVEKPLAYDFSMTLSRKLSQKLSNVREEPIQTDSFASYAAELLPVQASSP